VIEPSEDKGADPATSSTSNRRLTNLLAELHPRRFFLETWRQIDVQAASERALFRSYDYRPLAALAVGAACLTLMEYFGSSRQFFALVERFANGDNVQAASLAMTLQESRFERLIQLVWWCAWRVLCYFLIPAAVVRFGFRQRLRDYGLNPTGVSRHLWIWGVCYVPMLTIIVLASLRSDFIRYYPFYEQAHRSWFDLLVWEFLYAAQFFSLEFFFRGFWLAACKPTMGSQAIFAMVVPYCMIHFGKPWPETMSAIFAGVFLGTLAFRSRSIWIGFLIHESVALSMDLVALLKTSGLPHLWWPL
jgi:membrane protease YdiL (CAAX protease family)